MRRYHRSELTSTTTSTTQGPQPPGLNWLTPEAHAPRGTVSRNTEPVLLRKVTKPETPSLLERTLIRSMPEACSTLGVSRASTLSPGTRLLRALAVARSRPSVTDMGRLHT